MSSTPIKRQNHRIHPCNRPLKNELIHFLIERNAGKSILVVTSTEAGELPTIFAGKNITVLSDAELAQTPDLRCEVLISYDLPEKAIVYMSRYARAREYALITLDEEDQKRLYPIELLNGRTITQEVVKGFEPDFGIAVDNQQKAEAKARRDEREARDAADPRNRDKKPVRDTRPERLREDSRGDKRPPRNEGDGFMAKKQHNAKPRFVGKDDSGKPIFEGKTRERNHYIDGTPRSDAEKATKPPYSSKPKFFGDKEKSSAEKKPYGEKKPFGDKKPYGDKPAFGEKKPYGDKKPFGDKKPYGDKPAFGEKKPYGDKKPFGDKKPYGDKPAFGEKKPYGDKKPFGDKKPYGDKKPFGDKKPYQDRKPSEAPAAPKRAPRRIDVKSFKSPKESE